MPQTTKAEKAAYMRAYTARRNKEETPEQRERRLAVRRASESTRREQNREEYNAKQRERRANNRERYRENNRSWYWRHHEQTYIASLEAGQRYRFKIRLEVLKKYGGDPPSCACCGETQTAFLCLDHIDGGGNQHRKSLPPGTNIYTWVKKNDYPKLFQVLCHNCNMSKGHYGKCPHDG